MSHRLRIRRRPGGKGIADPDGSMQSTRCASAAIAAAGGRHGPAGAAGDDGRSDAMSQERLDLPLRIGKAVRRRASSSLGRK